MLWKRHAKARGWKKFLGIMFKPRLREPLLFDFEREGTFSNSIHSAFCIAFDAIFLDSGKKIVEVRRVRPFRFVVPKKKCRYLIEAPAGDAARLGLRKGMALDWK